MWKKFWETCQEITIKLIEGGLGIKFGKIWMKFSLIAKNFWEIISIKFWVDYKKFQKNVRENIKK